MKNPGMKLDGKILLIIAGWLCLTCILFFGVVEMSPEGHIENSLVISFAVIVLAIHLVSVLRKISCEFLMK